jgi:predicted RND superfamily exporter protein
VIIVVVVPCFLAVGHSNFEYGTGSIPAGTRAASDSATITQEFGSSDAVVALVPRGDVAREAELSTALEQEPYVKSVMSYANTVGTVIPPEYLSSKIVSQFYSDPNATSSTGYARIIIYTDPPSTDEAFTMVQDIRDTIGQYYDTSYTAGTDANTYDIKSVVSSDHDFVDLLSILAIGLVILLIFRSIGLPIILVASIEIAINMNMAVPYFTNSPIMFIGYLILSTVQLASSADYAILYTQHYLRDRRTMPARLAAQTAHSTAFKPIITSAAILSLAGFALYGASTISMVKEIGLLLGRGTLISLVIVTCFLPAMLVILDKIVRWTSWKPGFYQAKHKVKERDQHEG